MALALTPAALADSATLLGLARAEALYVARGFDASPRRLMSKRL